MKKIYVIIIFLFTIIDLLNGQSAIELSQGFNYSFLSDSKLSDPHYSGGKYKSQISSALEINYLKRHERFINYRISISYISRNFNMVSSMEEHFYTRIIDADFKLRYISFAFLPEIAFSKKSRIFFNIGPSLDFLAFGNQRGSNYADELSRVTETTFTSRVINYNVSQTFNTLLIGMKSGIRFAYPFTDKLVFQFKSNFTYIFNNFASGEISNYVLTHSRNLTCLAGVCYYIKK
jgi:hypothetical protein